MLASQLLKHRLQSGGAEGGASKVLQPQREMKVPLTLGIIDEIRKVAVSGFVPVVAVRIERKIATPTL
jgi:hypothetical protein